jgi:uncharacterized protein (DUF2252 family)
MPLDAFQLARRQLQLDRDRMREFPWLIPHKVELMRASALGFLRGSAPLFYEILKSEPALADGPGGKGWITGDLHLENFGAYRRDALEGPELPKVVFNLNDFDEAVIGPWRFDMLRLLTSFILAARGLGPSGPQIIESAEAMIDSYVATAMRGAKIPEPPPAVKRLMEKVRDRTRKELLDQRTELVGGKRRFIRGKRFRSLGRELAPKAPRAFEDYAKQLTDLQKTLPEALQIVDLAFRIAGTGSLGQLRVAVLVEGKGGPNGEWMFDMKEERSPAPGLLVDPLPLEPAERVLSALRACLEAPPLRIGATRLDGKSMFVRRLAPQEDRVNTRGMDFGALSKLTSYFAALTGAAHRRGAKDPRQPRWSRAEGGRLLDSALVLAGIHEGAYSAYCRLSPRDLDAPRET